MFNRIFILKYKTDLKYEIFKQFKLILALKKNKRVNKNKYIIKKIYLDIPYKYKDDGKKKGTQWDTELKKWWIFDNNINKDYLLSKYKPISC